MDVDFVDPNRRSLGAAKSQSDVKDVHGPVDVERASGRRVIFF